MTPQSCLRYATASQLRSRLPPQSLLLTASEVSTGHPQPARGAFFSFHCPYNKKQTVHT